MNAVDMPRLRNVVLAGHSASGKTTLAEHMLHTSGAINRMGRVDDGTASLDFEPEEHKRHISLSLAVATIDHNGHEITLLDTPGYADFSRRLFASATSSGFTPGTSSCCWHIHPRPTPSWAEWWRAHATPRARRLPASTHTGSWPP